MEKEEIKSLLDSVLSFADEHDPIGFLEFDVRAMEIYIRKAIGVDRFRITKLQHDDDNFKSPKTEKHSAIAYYTSTQDNFEKRSDIAVGLGIIADHYLIEKPLRVSDWQGYDSKRILYFAQRILQSRSGILDDCATFRNGYTLSVKEIPKRLSELFDIGNGETYKESDIAADIRQNIDRLLKDIHSEMPDDGLLDHDTRLVSMYIKKKYDVKDALINRRPMCASKLAHNKCRLHCYPTKNRFSIWYPEGINPIEKRVLIGHELGDIVCHWDPKRGGHLDEDETPMERRDSTYFARLLLEHRAKLYLSGNKDDHYQASCQKIAEAITNIYKRQGKKWLEWVLED